ncbi:phenylacetate-CoA oxygenase subunit PaaJ [Peribacillus cavernae]|uniref:Phenylacetate-CoA oxygenase subunit PaaJ n=1 Tax=Peribacillus cavernae TaxID=1674310 RepID=A0A3S0W1X9_9BACI|nr:1,2-phenylacetyl-CoA epoxidase subunit PaaD [Peribacillus cavernae]MDQ0218723.1 ring-1,2-phenylacetyl-CoA epoxidase subunit PaaD [Peribacillus cavernae]RUQ30938.1 phenylacetate-CoA oxygenase subunit PaaJ [Peribacillus cavernae]
MIATNEEVWKVLLGVNDPEINTVSIVDLGMVESINIGREEIRIKIIPTFLGCPALPIIQKNIENAVKEAIEVSEVTVEFVCSAPWTSDRITERGREGLQAFGISPPPRHIKENGEWQVDCPYCGSTYVTFDNLFGPTACRSILYCRSCKNPFEAMKPMSTDM